MAPRGLEGYGVHPRAMATSGTAKPFPPFPGITAGGRPSWNQFHRPELGFVRGSGIPPSRPRCMTISLAPPTKAGPFSRGQLLVNERDDGRPKRLHRPQLRGGLFRFFWRGTAVLRTAELLQQLQLLSKRKQLSATCSNAFLMRGSAAAWAAHCCASSPRR